MEIKRKIKQEVKERRSELNDRVKKLKDSNKGIVSPQVEDDNAFNVAEFYKNLTPMQKEAFDKQLKFKKIRNNYAEYVKYVYGDNYLMTKFHGVLCKLAQSVITKMEHGERVRLCISMSPQHGKSKTFTETLPSWFIGRHPNGKVILTGYNSDIAVKFGDNNRNLIKDFGKELFDIEPSESMDRKDEFGIKGYEGKIVSRGLLGGITSNAGNFVIIDDPFKNGEEANNPDIRERVWRVFCDSVMTRVHGSVECKGDAVIVIHNRWHEDDLIGRLSKEEGWIVVNIPCIWEDRTRKDTLLGRHIGETLCPELGFDFDWACKTRKLLGERVFMALYQGKPFIDTGNLIKRENIRIYNKNSKPYTFEEITMSCDLTFGANTKNSDPYCISIWGRNGADHYLLDVVSKKAGFKETLEIIKVLSAKYPTMRKKLIEKKANGQATIEMLNSHIGGMIPFTPTGSKEDRFNAVCPYFEAGNVFFPDESLQQDIEFYINQLLKFPNGEHDDFVDTVSQYLLNYQYKYGGKVQTNSGLALLSKALRGIKL